MAERNVVVYYVCYSYYYVLQGRIIHEAGEAEASGPGPR